ncbi:MAG TPA: hypothetical protein VHB21_07230 [Minicystis sp.]|nr:hypothetical protein [Minicystis sp.]
MRMATGVVAVVGGLGLAGCGHPIQFVPASVPVETRPYQVIGEAHGKQCSRLLLMVIPLGFSESLHGAYEDAMSDVKGTQGLVEMTIDSYTTDVIPGLPIIYHSECTEIHGKAIRFMGPTPWVPPGAVLVPAPGPPAAAPPPPAR